MKIKLLTAAAAIVLSGFSAQAHAATGQTWTVTVTGHIRDGGYTLTNDFGPVGQAGADASIRLLSGLQYTYAITASTDPAQWYHQASGGDFMQLDTGAGLGPAFTVTATVDGHSATYSSTSTEAGKQRIANYATQGHLVAGSDSVFSTQAGYAAGGDYLIATIAMFTSAKPFVPTADFNHSIATTSTVGPLGTYSGYASFYVYGTQRASFVGDVDSIAVSASAVPEPETYAMLLAGLGLMGFAARRNRKSA